ncbi:hypothetical protein C7212DRAFT_363384 [Tuber magnatum]|uniref:Uncharacterized protein n=1 Tax=Tuber magnatum TaxID=42249 RepID=A0A317SRD7_9PEZI|nr:hypothetical protein C7212DRAFT_363384 [Tuber magnatum]
MAGYSTVRTEISYHKTQNTQKQSGAKPTKCTSGPTALWRLGGRGAALRLRSRPSRYANHEFRHKYRTVRVRPIPRPVRATRDGFFRPHRPITNALRDRAPAQTHPPSPGYPTGTIPQNPGYSRTMDRTPAPYRYHDNRTRASSPSPTNTDDSKNITPELTARYRTVLVRYGTLG